MRFFLWLLVTMYLMCGPRQLFFQCGPETPKGQMPCEGGRAPDDELWNPESCLPWDYTSHGLLGPETECCGGAQFLGATRLRCRPTAYRTCPGAHPAFLTAGPSRLLPPLVSPSLMVWWLPWPFLPPSPFSFTSASPSKILAHLISFWSLLLTRPRLIETC